MEGAMLYYPHNDFTESTQQYGERGRIRYAWRVLEMSGQWNKLPLAAHLFIASVWQLMYTGHLLAPEPGCQDRFLFWVGRLLCDLKMLEQDTMPVGRRTVPRRALCRMLRKAQTTVRRGSIPFGDMEPFAMNEDIWG